MYHRLRLYLHRLEWLQMHNRLRLRLHRLQWLQLDYTTSLVFSPISDTLFQFLGCGLFIFSS